MNTSNTNTQQTNPYDPGHPWYYVLRGDIRYPKQILAEVTASGYHGYMIDRIMEIARKAEPQRSTGLRQLRATVMAEFRRDLSRYREVVRELHAYRQEKSTSTDQPECTDIHVSVSLKHNHLCNSFAHLLVINQYLVYQRDLFDP